MRFVWGRSSVLLSSSAQPAGGPSAMLSTGRESSPRIGRRQAVMLRRDRSDNGGGGVQPRDVSAVIRTSFDKVSCFCRRWMQKEAETAARSLGARRKGSKKKIQYIQRSSSSSRSVVVVVKHGRVVVAAAAGGGGGQVR